MGLLNIISGALTRKKSCIDMLYADIDNTNNSIIEHRNSFLVCNMKCKETEDAYDDTTERLDIELEELKVEYMRYAARLLDNFPLNKPCTIPYIADYIGVKDKTVLWNIFMVGIHGLTADILESYTHSCGYDVYYDIVSESRLDVRVELDDLLGYSGEYKRPLLNYNMKLDNWRFVASKHDKIFYVERVS